MELFSRNSTSMARKLMLSKDDPCRNFAYPTAISSTLEVGTHWFGGHQLDGAFFITQLGLVGCATSSISKGDKIIIPLVSSTPASVRRSIHRSRWEPHSLVGECYVDGIMHGELTAFSEKRQITTRTYEFM